VNPSSLAGIITASATVITAVGGLVLALGVLIPTLRNSQVAKQAAVKAVEGVQEVHTMVNQQRTDMQKRVEDLIAALQAAGVRIPKDQSLTEATDIKQT